MKIIIKETGETFDNVEDDLTVHQQIAVQNLTCVGKMAAGCSYEAGDVYIIPQSTYDQIIMHN